MAAIYSSSSSNYSSDENEDSTEFDGVDKVDWSHQELDAEMLQFHLQDVSKIPDRLAEVKKLVLSNNSLELLPETVIQFRNLAELDLSNNGLTFLPESLGTQLPSLTHLAVRNNLITESEFPKDVSGLARSLKYLNLSGNRFSAIPPQLLQLTGLTSLYIGGNQIPEVPAGIRSLQALKYLYLGGNLLKRLPKEICHLEQLRALFLCFNQLESLPDCICRLKKLKCLQLHSNRLTTLPNGLVFLNSLIELSLRENPLVVRFVRQMDNQVSSLLELSARAIKFHRISYNDEDLPRGLSSYLKSAQQCVNPKCCGVYFESRFEHVKFVDFCGRYRIPLMQYLCSANCDDEHPAVELEEDNRMKKVLLG